jgi:hypothetical protein
MAVWSAAADTLLPQLSLRAAALPHSVSLQEGEGIKLRLRLGVAFALPQAAGGGSSSSLKEGGAAGSTTPAKEAETDVGAGTAPPVP